MAKIDYNAVFDAVTLALHAAFPGSGIFGGEVKQGLNNGDFIVLPMNSENSREMGSRFAKSVTFDVIYFPSFGEGMRVECLEKADILGRVLETVQTSGGDIVHCTEFSSEISDDTLHCFVSYPFFTYSAYFGEDNTMETLIIEQEVKQDD